ncbi:PRTRC system protein B [Mucilaginibacter lacusdianchii]|uniref:PRTRC system protein B n=1 Tax=Mucilaginibacter lacusdianchii TaxID=2684211 RepID=UPI00131CDF42|nr:PRTRC system protein B [Mucilaginibacter sp. JXJ CY 39]
MQNITADFGHLYHPHKALVIFKKQGSEPDYYIESYDMDSAGRPINAHPLSVRESTALARSLRVSERKTGGFLMPEGLLPSYVLYIHPGEGWALWHTPPREETLLFSPSLPIPSGRARVPGLIWKAGKNSLQVFAVKGETVTLETPLCKAPFFNVYKDGKVCMGNVQVKFPASCSLERFIQGWQQDFYNSYFSHTIHSEGPIKGNIVQLWQHLCSSGEPFPQDRLIETQYQLKYLLP